MLRKLFHCLGHSKHAPSLSLRSPPERSPEEVADPRDLNAVHTVASVAVDAAVVVDTWAASVPIDLLLEIFLCLEPAAVVCCAGVCKPWRRAIIGNAAILGPRLDRFGPSLLLGIFHYNKYASSLWRTPGPFQFALQSSGGRGSNQIFANHLTPAAASAAIPSLLWSRDGFILLRARRSVVSNLCLCNPVTGYCTIVPAAAAKDMHIKYFLLTSSSSSSHDDPPVRILAVHRRDCTNISVDKETLAYQIFSISGERAGLWGPIVQCFGDELEAGCHLCVWMDRRSTAIDLDTVYWLAGHIFGVTCVFALDVRTGRTWTIELPMQYHLPTPDSSSSSILAMSSGRLSMLKLLSGLRIQVAVLSGDAKWTLQRTISIDKYNLQPHCLLRSCGLTSDVPQLSAFCPRSRCVVALWSE